MMPSPTLPGLLLRNAAAHPAKPAFRHRRRGIWHTLTWAGFAGMVRDFALGLAAHGFGPGARLAVLGENEPRGHAALLAAQALGGIALPLDPEADGTALQRWLRAANAGFLLVDRPDQAERVDALGPPALVICKQDHPDFVGFATLVATGDASAGSFNDEAARRMPSDPAILLPHGPRLIELSDGTLLDTAQMVAVQERIGAEDQAFCYQPLSSVGELVYSLSLGLLCGFCCNFPERPDTVPRDLREIGPTFLLTPPRALDLLAAELTRRLGTTSGIRRFAFQHCRGAAIRATELRERRSRVSLPLHLSRAVGALVIDGPVRDQLGLRRTRFIHVGPGEPSPDTATLFRSLAIPLRPAILPDPAELPALPAREPSHV